MNLQTEINFSGISLHNENSREMESFLIENSNHFDGNVKKVWELLNKGERLRVFETQAKYQIASLPRRIKDIKDYFDKINKPHPIKTERIGRIVEYSLNGNV